MLNLEYFAPSLNALQRSLYTAIFVISQKICRLAKVLAFIEGSTGKADSKGSIALFKYLIPLLIFCEFDDCDFSVCFHITVTYIIFRKKSEELVAYF